MTRFHLRTLLILVAILPPLLAGFWLLGRMPVSDESRLGGPLVFAALLLVLGTLAAERG